MSFTDVCETVLYKTKAACGKIRLVQRQENSNYINFVQIGKFTKQSNASKLVVTLNALELKWLVSELPVAIENAEKKKFDVQTLDGQYRKFVMKPEKFGDNVLVAFHQEVTANAITRYRDVSFTQATCAEIVKYLSYYLTCLTEYEKQIQMETDDMEDLPAVLAQLTWYYTAKNTTNEDQQEARGAKNTQKQELEKFKKQVENIAENTTALLTNGKLVLQAFGLTEDYDKFFVESLADLLKTELETIRVLQFKSSIDAAVKFLLSKNVKKC